MGRTSCHQAEVHLSALGRWRVRVEYRGRTHPHANSSIAKRRRVAQLTSTPWSRSSSTCTFVKRSALGAVSQCWMRSRCAISRSRSTLGSCAARDCTTAPTRCTSCSSSSQSHVAPSSSSAAKYRRRCSWQRSRDSPAIESDFSLRLSHPCCACQRRITSYISIIVSFLKLTHFLRDAPRRRATGSVFEVRSLFSDRLTPCAVMVPSPGKLGGAEGMKWRLSCRRSQSIIANGVDDSWHEQSQSS